MNSLKSICIGGVLLVLLAVLGTFGAFSVLFAQEETPETGKTADSTVLVREQTIYIPYENLRKTFEKNGRGVFMPYEEFRALWDAAREKDKRTENAQKAPIPFLITETVNEAVVSDEIVKVTANVRIEILQEGWKEIPLNLKDIAITEATIEGKPARLLGNAGEGYKLIVDSGKLDIKDGKIESKTVELTLKYAKTITKSPGHNSVAFEVPQAPVSRWTVKIPDTGVKVDFFPLIAASEEKAEAKEEPATEPQEEEKKGTTVLAFVGPSPVVRIGWTPKSEGASGLEALTSVQLEEKVTINEGVLETQAILDYSISRSQIERLAIQVPGDQNVIGVFDPNVKSWAIKQGENVQTVEIELFEPAKDKQRVILTLEKLFSLDSEVADEKAETAKSQILEMPTIKALGVGRQQGVMVVNSVEALNIDSSKVTGLMQMDRAELPAALTQTNWSYAYRLSTAEYLLALSIEKVQPRIEADTQITARLTVDQVSLTMWTRYSIEKAGVFQLSCDIPADFRITGVTGYTGQNLKPVSVGSYNLVDIPSNGEGEEKSSGMKRLNIQLSSKAIGNVGLQVLLSKRLDHNDLRVPTGNAVGIDFKLPLVTADSVQRREGKMVFTAEDRFRIVKTETDGLKTTPIDQIRSEWIGSFPNPQLGFVYGQESPKLTLQIERRKPQITIRQFQKVQIEDGVVKYNVRFYYDILYSGIKSIRVDVPEVVSSRLRNNSNLRDARMSPQPEDVPEGYIAWEFTSGNELLGNGSFGLSWEDELKQLDLGKSVEIEIPRLIPRGANRAYGHIAITKAETIDLSEPPGNKGLRGIDPQHELPEENRTPDAAAAFEFFEDWNLKLVATRYELEEVKRTSLEKGLVRAVMINNSDTLSVQALYQIRSVQQRLVLSMPVGAEFDLDPRINGVPVTREKDGSDDNVRYYIPLNSTSPNASFLLELRYNQPKNAGSILLPEFPDDPAVQEMFIAVYVPQDSLLYRHKGAWTPLSQHHVDTSAGAFRQTVASYSSPDIGTIINQMRSACGASVQEFPTEGRAYLFTALQPGKSGEAVLKVFTVKEKLFYGVSFTLLILAGLILTRYPWRCRVVAVIGILLAVFLIGIFLPGTVSLFGTCESGIPSQFTYAFWIFLFGWALLSVFDGFKKLTKKCPKNEEPVAATVPVVEKKTESAPETSTEPEGSSEEPKEGGENNA